MIALVLLATLSWTMPSTTMLSDASGRIVSCKGGPSIRTLSGWRVYAQVQSRTWRDHGAEMLSDPVAWAQWWPSVAIDAMPRQVRSASTKNLPSNGAGARITLAVPDSLDGEAVLCWYVVTFNDSLWTSCPSNLRPAR